MSDLSELLSPGVWPVLHRKIVERRADFLESLLGINSLEDLRRIQGSIAALDWVVEEAKPKRKLEEEEE